MGIVGLLAGFLTDRYGARPLTLSSSGLLLIGLILLTLILAHPTSALDCAWRLALIGIAMGLFNGPNQTLLMSVGTRETMGAASALSNLSARLGSILGPLLLAILWSLLPDLTLQMSTGAIVLVGLAALSVLCAWMMRSNTQFDSTKNGTALNKQGIAC
jgi:MFS family permease